MSIVTDYLDRSAQRYPGKTVIRDIKGELTYGQLRDRAVNAGVHISRYIDHRRNMPVAVLIDKGCECLTAIFGILYSGNCYVPLDIKTPKDRLLSILKTMESDVIIADEKTKAILDKYECACRVLLFEELMQETGEDNEVYIRNIRRQIVDTDLMYILFTSGSTGDPKGVAIMHRSVSDYITSFTKAVPMDESDVIGNQVPFYVDMSLKDIYMTIASGAEVVVIPQTYFMSPKKLLTYLDENHVTMLMWVPTAYSIISRFDGLSRVKPASLKKLVFSGEVMPSSVYRYWAKEYPDALWIQLYGPTEITGACTYFILDREYEEDEMIPIGKAFDNTGILLLDENDAEIKEADVSGEICIYGSCLAAGYYNDPEKTQQSFVQNPLVKAYPSRMYRTGDLAKWNENGDLVFVSRMDYQIKHGGRRIELGEIEAAADLVENIGNVCVVHDSGTDTIVMVYTGELTDKDIRSQLKDRLPQYMIPGKYIRTESLPQLPNGKLNRKAVLQMVQEAE